MTTNMCPACGPVETQISSRYCVQHLRELLARCVDAPPSARRAIDADPMEWLEMAVQGRHAA